jgi:uncharacterized protein
MYDAIFVAPWPWWVAGPAIGVVATLLAWLTGKTLGVSTAYGSACALTSRLAFFRAPEYRERWRLAFVVGLPIGGVLAGLLAGRWAPTLGWGQLDVLTGGSLGAKAGVLIAGGMLIGAGTRWARGCPSGHTIAGIAQGAGASLVATMAFMAGGLVVFNVLYAVLGGR